MIVHYIIFIVLITIVVYKFYRIIIKTKHTNDFMVKGRESSIVTTVSLVFSFLCLCNLIIFIVFLIQDINYLAFKEINFNLIDLLVPHKFNELIEPLSEDIRGNIFEISSLISVQKSLVTVFYSIMFIFIGLYFYYANSRFVYINNDSIYKLDNIYRWNTEKSHQWDRIFGKDILNVNVIDENGRLEVISIRLYNDDKKILETLIGTK